MDANYTVRLFCRRYIVQEIVQYAQQMHIVKQSFTAAI